MSHKIVGIRKNAISAKLYLRRNSQDFCICKTYLLVALFNVCGVALRRHANTKHIRKNVSSSAALKIIFTSGNNLLACSGLIVLSAENIAAHKKYKSVKRMSSFSLEKTVIKDCFPIKKIIYHILMVYLHWKRKFVRELKNIQNMHVR